jgi:hypothetical protein
MSTEDDVDLSVNA